MDINQIRKANDYCLKLKDEMMVMQESLAEMLDALDEYQDFLLDQIRIVREPHVRHIPVEIQV